MYCHLVLDLQSRGWIIEKMCRRLGAELEDLGHTVSIGDQPNATADMNHFMFFWSVPKQTPPQCTVAITHVDDSHRLALASAAISRTVMAICMSSMTVKQLVLSGLPRAKMCYVLPAFDGGLEPRRIVVGLTTKIYPEGRKREDLLVRLAKEMNLSSFHFEIFGSGWESVVEVLRVSGATVLLHVDGADPISDYRLMKERIPHFDYYLYTGLDEGSMGTLDALAAGVKTIVTSQGFHVDLPHGITHPFWDYQELRAVFEGIREERNSRVRAVEKLTWRRYAERHLLIWQTMIDGRTGELPQLLGQESLAPLGGYGGDMDAHMASERRRLWFRTLRRYKLPLIKPAIKRILKKMLPKGITNYLSRSNRARNG